MMWQAPNLVHNASWLWMHKCKGTHPKSHSLWRKTAGTCQILYHSIFIVNENRHLRKNVHFKLHSGQKQNQIKISILVFFHSFLKKVYKLGRCSDISHELSIPLRVSNKQNLNEFRNKAVCGTIKDLSAVKVESSSYPWAPPCHRFPVAWE